MIFRVLAIRVRVSMISSLGFIRFIFLERIRHVQVADVFNRSANMVTQEI